MHRSSDHPTPHEPDRPDEPAEIREHPVLWEAVLRQIPAGAVVMEAHGRKVLLRNRAAARILGLSESEAADSFPVEAVSLFTPDGTPMPAADWPIMRVLRTGRSTRGEELLIRRPDGRRVTILMDTTPVHDARGKVIAGVCTFHDVSRQKNIEEDLRREREKLKSILDAIPDTVYICSADYIVEYANPAAVAQFGPPDGQKCYQYVHGRDTFCPDCRAAEVFAGSTVHREWTNPATGVTFDMLECPIHNTDGSISRLRIARDISARKRAENDLRRMRDELETRVQQRTAQLRDTVSTLRDEVAERLDTEKALREANELLERVFADVHLLVAYLDRDFNFIRVNRAYAEVDGRGSDFFPGKNHFDLYPHPENEKIFRRVLETGTPYFVVEKPFSYPHRPELGVTYWDWTLQPVREPDGVISGLVLTLINVTERRRTREALLAAEGRYRLIVQEAARGIIITDDHAVVLEANPAACNFFGRPASELIGRPIERFFTHDDLEYIRRKTQAVVQGQTVDWDRPLRRPEGSTIYLEGSANLLLDGRILLIMNDVTARKESEHLLREYQDRLKSLAVELTRVEEEQKRRLAVDLHDRVGQALALCKLKLGLLGQELPPGKTGDLLNDVSALIEQTIADTHTLSFELYPPVLRELGLAPAAEWLVEQIHRQYPLDLRFVEDNPPRHIEHDLRTVLFRCLQELLMNVVRHANARAATVTLQGDDRLVRLCVEDDGVGFDAEKAFDARTGFGLFSIRERLTYFGGNVLVSSRPGKGSTVVLTVPLNTPKRTARQNKGDSHEQQNPDR